MRFGFWDTVATSKQLALYHRGRPGILKFPMHSSTGVPCESDSLRARIVNYEE
jgi:hypothetical protein